MMPKITPMKWRIELGHLKDNLTDTQLTMAQTLEEGQRRTSGLVIGRFLVHYGRLPRCKDCLTVTQDSRQNITCTT